MITRRGYCSWTVDHAGWVVTLHSPEEQTLSGKTLEAALAWCLVWLMAKGPQLTGDMSWASGRSWSDRPERLATVVGVLALVPLHVR
jgi:hypothetical protein